MTIHNNYINLTELGRLYGVSSHNVGNALKQIGLRDRNGSPSALAFMGNYCEQAPTNRGSGYYYIWDQAKTIKALEAAGYKTVSEASSISHLRGPFVLNRSGSDTWEIKNGDGSTSTWAVGEADAIKLCELMNWAYKTWDWFQ
jgi:hypothetical protein